MKVIQERFPVGLSDTWLLDKRVPKRMVTWDQIPISLMELCQEFQGRDTSELPGWPKITPSASKDKVPYPIDEQAEAGMLQQIWEEMIESVFSIVPSPTEPVKVLAG